DSELGEKCCGRARQRNFRGMALLSHHPQKAESRPFRSIRNAVELARMNDYDKAGRYLAKRDSAGFLRWLVNNPGLAFHSWIDARRLALPKQRDLTNDLVAALKIPGDLEALCIEIQAIARA